MGLINQRTIRHAGGENVGIVAQDPLLPVTGKLL
jgi:hypothetical protein